MARRWCAISLASLAIVLAVASCSGQGATPRAVKSVPPTGPIASNLPPGVCAPTYEQLNEPDATRIEAKLVTRETLMGNDPEFVPTWHTDTHYFWIIAEVGQFVFSDAPMPPGSTPAVLHNVLSYVQANVVPGDPESVAHPCRGIGVRGTGANTWPAWFDRMPAVVDVKIH